MTTASKPPPTETASPQRNFTLATEDRVRAIAGGPPAFMKRLRAIEDLEEGIVRTLVTACEKALDEGLPRDALATHARASVPARAYERLVDLVARHNRYYPIEANLPMRPRTGELVDRTGEAWRPMVARTVEELVTRAIDRLNSSDTTRR